MCFGQTVLVLPATDLPKGLTGLSLDLGQLSNQSLVCSALFIPLQRLIFVFFFIKFLPHPPPSGEQTDWVSGHY